MNFKSRTLILKELMEALGDANTNVIGMCEIGGVTGHPHTPIMLILELATSL